MTDIGIITLGCILVLIVAAMFNIAGKGTQYEEGEHENEQGTDTRSHL